MARLATVLVTSLALFTTIGLFGAGDHAPVSASSSCVVNGSWPQYLGDPTHSANACSSITTSNVTTLTPSWYTGTAGAVTASPAVMPNIGPQGSVFDGDSSGVFYSFDETTGAVQWTFDTAQKAYTAAGTACFLDQPNDVDEHHAGFGEITSSPTVVTLPGATAPTVFFGAGDSLFALNALTGACEWAQDADPGAATNALEMESSPAIDTSLDPPEVLVGDDDNSSSGIAVTGLQTFDALTGTLLWRYEPERDLTLTPSEFDGSAYYTLSCGDGTDGTDPALPGTSENQFCNETNIPGLPPANSTTYADGCGDVWSSVALDTGFVDPAGDNTFEGSGPSGPVSTPPATTDWEPSLITATGGQSLDGLALFGTGNCAANPNPAAALAHGDYAASEGIFALDPVTGHRVWDFIEPYNAYVNNIDEPGDGDDDFGSSALLATVPATSTLTKTCGLASSAPSVALVIEGSKSGYAYGVCESDGGEVWSVQASQAGELTQSAAGSVGGFLGSAALGSANGRPTVFFTSAIPLPFTNDGIREPGSNDDNISSCPGPVISDVPVLPPACPDLSLLSNPQRLVSLHAIDAATGAVVWQALSLPTYSAASYTNGVVFFPDTTGFSLVAYDAQDGLPLWAFPLGAATASGAAIVGDRVFVGAGLAEESEDGVTIPPGANGVWSFSTTPGLPNITPPPLP